MINFIYLGETTVEHDDLDTFMEVATKFQIKGLRQEKSKADKNDEIALEEEHPTGHKFVVPENPKIEIEDYNFTQGPENHDENVIKSDWNKMEEGSKVDGKFYHCEKCEYKCTLVHNLKRHLKTVHSSLKFPCDLCSFESSFSHNVLRHKKTRH